MTFQVGEKVVYPNHGVGTIENISSRAFGAQSERFYLLRLSPSRMTVMVPFSHVGDVGLRKVTKCSEINRVLSLSCGRRASLLPSRLEGSVQRKFRHDEGRQPAGDGGSIQGAADHSDVKPLSFREKKMLERARSMLILETSVARAVSEPDAGALFQVSRKCGLTKCGTVDAGRSAFRRRVRAISIARDTESPARGAIV